MKFKNLLLPKDFCKDPINLVSTEVYDKKTYSLKEFLKQIDFNKSMLKKIEATLHGIFQAKNIGTGFDFNEIREYKIGDDLRHISWSTTAKTGKLHTKEYFAEKEVRSYFLIDISNSMFCGNKIEPFVQIFAILLNLASNFSEKIGAVFFSDDIKYHFPLSSTHTQSNLIFQSFIDFFYKLSNKNGDQFTKITPTNIFKAIDFTKRFFIKKGIIFIISDFIYPTNEWEKIIFEISQKQNIYSFQIFDILDFNLPRAGYVSLYDPETQKLSFVNTDSKDIQLTYNKLMLQKQAKIESFFKTIGINHFVIDKSDFT